jgi:lipopolysaccharide/colanic/teichoic acid biosynthesis glycosyltransferase
MTDEQKRAAARKLSLLILGHQIVALAMLILLTPLVTLIVIAIVIDSGLPVFFSQERLGLYGRRFRMLKFRKFRTTIRGDTQPLTLENDPRFGRFGAFLAHTKLDELPQLWNVVRADMLIVGPRPEVPDFAECFAGPFERLLDYHPGIFGPSQAAFRSEGALYPPDQDPQDFYRQVLFPAKASLDLAYYPARSVVGDIKWVVRSFRAVCGFEHDVSVCLRRDALARASKPAAATAGDAAAA